MKNSKSWAIVWRRRRRRWMSSCHTWRKRSMSWTKLNTRPSILRGNFTKIPLSLKGFNMTTTRWSKISLIMSSWWRSKKVRLEISKNLWILLTNVCKITLWSNCWEAVNGVRSEMLWKQPWPNRLRKSTCWVFRLLRGTLLPRKMLSSLLILRTFLRNTIMSWSKSMISLEGPKKGCQLYVSWRATGRQNLKKCSWRRVFSSKA